jgi:putative endonuclease
MYYVYLIQSINSPDKKYIEYTTDLKERLNRHNSGRSVYTSAHCPWELIAFIGFKNKDRAVEFEKYLKTGSGYMFLKKRVW